MLVALDAKTDVPRPGLRVSSNPVQPQEAIDFFGKKSPLPKDAWATIGEDARKRAFTAAWVTDVNVLQSIKDSLDKAIADGESFDSWKKRIRKELGEKWSRSSAYLETVFRNNVQSAYAAGHYKAATQSIALKLRPFWRLVILLDGRTSDVCRPLAKPPVVLPAEDPWWATNYPPRHHLCRSTVVSLRRRTAEQIGILKTPPSTKAQDGWGSTAGLGAWQPSGDALDPKLFRPAEKASERALPKQEPTVEPPKVVRTPEVRPAEEPNAPAPEKPKAAPAEEPKATEPIKIERVTESYAKHLKKRKVVAPDTIDDTARAVFGDAPPSIDSLEKIWSAPGIEVKIDRISTESFERSTGGTQHEITITGQVRRNGKAAGAIGRTFTKHPDGRLEVRHGVFMLTAAAQGQGIGETMMRQAVLAYPQLGADEITVDAVKVGSYTWASFGYNWDNKEAERQRGMLAEFLQKHGVSRQRAEDIAARASKNSWDVAALDVDGILVEVEVEGKKRKERLGKAFMLSQKDRGWRGVLKLDKSSPSYKRAKTRLRL